MAIRRNDLGKDPIGKLVLRLAIPSMLAQFVSVLYSIVDRMYIGNIPETGDIALAGVGVCGPIVTLINSFALLIGIGGAPLAAIRMGEKNLEGARQILSNCFLMLLGIAVFLTAFFLCMKNSLLMAFGASEATFSYADEYITICVSGTIFAIMATGLNQFIICQGFSGMAMISVMIGAAMNIALDPVFIFVFQMGVRGAALATVLSQMASFSFVLLFLRSSKAILRLKLGGYSLRIMRRVLTFGFSPFIICATDSVLIIAMNSVLQHYGGPENGDAFITCATVVQSYMQLITMPMAGITGGTQPILSFNYGSGDTDRIRVAFRRIILLCVGFTTLMFCISQTCSALFVALFTKDAGLTNLSIWGIRIFTLGIIPLAFQYEIVDGFTALGIARISVTLSLTRKILYLILTLVLPIFFGASGAFYAEPAVDILCGILSTITFLLNFNTLMRRRQEIPEGTALYS